MDSLRSVCRLLVCLVAIVAFADLARAETAPVVIVIHGIGGGDRPDGWSDDAARAYGTDVREVTFRYGGRGVPESFKDFAPLAGDWALQVQRDIQNVAQSNPGRRLVIVSHSWGTVVTKMALDGGSAGGNSKELVASTYQVSPIQLQGGAMIDEWVTLGSPLGRGEGAKVAGTLDQVGVDITPGKPKVVRNWTNIYDANDPVAYQSHNLEGATNVEVKNKDIWVDIFGTKAHTKIWTEKKVVQYIQKRLDELAAHPLPRPKTPPPNPNTDPEAAPYERMAKGVIRANELDCQRKNSNPSYGGSIYSIEYTHMPTAEKINGQWFIVAGWKLMRKDPGRTSAIVGYQRGDDTKPDRIPAGQVAQWLAQEKIPWK